MRPKVQWEEMFPDELDAALARCPVGYLPLGLCEPHGLHNALGLDALKAPAQPASRTPGNPLGALTFGETERLWRDEIEPLLPTFVSTNMWPNQQRVDPTSTWAPNEMSHLDLLKGRRASPVYGHSASRHL